MSDYLLLTDKTKCPKCYIKCVPSSLPARCGNCGMRLFKAADSIKWFEADTGWREYWVWCGKQEGWKHRTQVFDPNPLVRKQKFQELDSDYGTEAYIHKQVDNSRIELKKALGKL